MTVRRVNRSALVPYSAEQMFAVVNDVPRYPEFLPWCKDSEVLSETSDVMIARLTLAKSGLQQDFTTHNELHHPDMIKMDLVNGPFSRLSGEWKFQPLGEDGCRASMHLEFDFSSLLFNMTLAKVFVAAADKMVEAFCERADKIYGE
jgi:ribosome-associated toxin RatA of RatAB toxin-antitoxin module